MPRFAAAALVLASLAGSVPSLAGQASATPQSYSLTELNTLISPEMTVVKIFRDGSKEILLQTRPATPAAPKGYQGGILLDFHAHVQYTWDATNGTPVCGKQSYADSTAPGIFDMVSGSAEILAALGDAKLVPAGRETVNGTPAGVFIVADSAQQLKMRIWLTDKTRYIVKMTESVNGASPATAMEVQALSFAKPPASAFTVPATCK